MQFHEIVCRGGVDQALDIPDGDPTTDRVQQFSPNHGNNQQWAILAIPNTPFVEVINRATGKALDVPGFNPAGWDGSRVRIAQTARRYPPLLTQSWSLFREDDGLFTIDSATAPIALRALETGKAIHYPNEFVLDIPGGVPQDGGDVQIFPFNGGGNQLWDVQVVEVEAFAVLQPNAEKGLDVPGYTRGDSAIQLYTFNGGTNQLWQLLDLNGHAFNPFPADPNHAGPLLIKSLCNNKVLQIAPDNLNVPFAPLVQADFTGNANQQWLANGRELMDPLGGVRFAFVLQNVGSGEILDELSHDDGTIVRQREDQGLNNSGWELARVNQAFKQSLS